MYVLLLSYVVQDLPSYVIAVTCTCLSATRSTQSDGRQRSEAEVTGHCGHPQPPHDSGRWIVPLLGLQVRHVWPDRSSRISTSIDRYYLSPCTYLLCRHTKYASNVQEEEVENLDLARAGPSRYYPDIPSSFFFFLPALVDRLKCRESIDHFQYPLGILGRKTYPSRHYE